jgi:pimeloyl-ACP methyl ester carboxylesterase
MPGRGDSAYLTDPQQYRPETFLLALMAVMQAFKDRRIGIIGKGWGALLALLLNAKMSFALDRLVVTDAPLSWSVDEDELPPADQLEFASLEAARQSVLASRELANLPEPFAAILADGRIRATESGRSALRFDPSLIAQLERYRGGALDTARLLARVSSPLLYLASNTLPDEDRSALQASLTNPGSTIADALAPNGRIHFNSAHQQLLLLGFLKNRVPNFA